MTGLIKSYDVVDHHGPMSVTTSDEYRQRILKMCSDIVKVQEVFGHLITFPEGMRSIELWSVCVLRYPFVALQEDFLEFLKTADR
jgi:hypothetical protein